MKNPLAPTVVSAIVSTVVSVTSSVISSTTQPSNSNAMKDDGSTGNVVVYTQF